MLAITKQGCADPWLTKAIDEYAPTNTPPEGGDRGICNSNAYYGTTGAGFYLDGRAYAPRVKELFDGSACDKWLTRALVEVLEFRPSKNHQEAYCEGWRYGYADGQTPSSYSELKQRVCQSGNPKGTSLADKQKRGC